MMDVVQERRPDAPIAVRFGAKPGDHEKITVNLGFVDLGQIDLLVRDGFYANRADFIRTAVRNQIERHADITRQSVARKPIEVGLRRYGRAELEAAQAAGVTVEDGGHAHPRACARSRDRGQGKADGGGIETDRICDRAGPSRAHRPADGTGILGLAATLSGMRRAGRGGSSFL